jgi:formylglycine-generating enzyme required for sulfatase activity/class 3 adenylate cyclase
MREKIRDINSARNSNNVPPGGAMPRRLAAIVAGDICGYSRLMQLDEEGTHARVRRIQRDLIEPSIAEHHGRLVKTTGDGFFAIFDSPVEAVRCGIVIQQNMFGRNASLPPDQRIAYRIGVNLGDVIIEEDDIYGEGVNIASRLEGLAEPGQVFISGGIYEQIKHKLVCGYESLGDRKVKNITDPVRVYRVLPDPSAFNRARKRRENLLIFLLSFALICIAGAAFWHWFPRERLREQASIQAAPTSAPPVPGRQAATPAQPGVREVARQVQPAVVPAPVSKPAPSQLQPSQLQSMAPAASAPPAAAALREPEMNLLRGGSFMMGSNEDNSEKPIHHVTIRPFAIGRYPVSVREWNQCAAARACAFVATGRDDAPITNVSWNDAKQFVSWLASVTHKLYRLPTEAEWEYAARGGSQTRYWWGDELLPGMASCKGCTSEGGAAEAPANVGSFRANPFGLYDMGGGVDQWVEDCWHRNYSGAPADGSAWMEGDCESHVIRSGSWKNDARYVRPANRDNYDTGVRYPTHGFRVALSP